MTITLDAALLYVVHRDGVTTTSSRVGTDLGWLSDVVHIKTLLDTVTLLLSFFFG